MRDNTPALAIISLAIIAALMVLALAFLVRRPKVSAADSMLLGAMQKHISNLKGKTAKKTLTAMRDLTALGGDMVSSIVLVCGTLILLARGNGGELALFAALLLGTRIAGLALKKIFRRERPPLSDQAMDTFTSSFPSIHTAMSFISFFAISALLISTENAPFQALAIGAGFSALVGFTRLYLSVHWPTDVLAGWLLGFCASVTGAYCILG